jgi:hypothetical protein
MEELLLKVAGATGVGVVLVWIIYDQRAQIKDLKAALLLKDAEISRLNELARTIQKESITVAMKITEVVTNLIEYVKDKLP